MKQNKTQEPEQSEPDELDKELKKPVKLYTKIKANNKIVSAYTKISKHINILADYESSLDQTNSHTESAIITGSEFVATKSAQAGGFVLASKVGLEIAASGGFTPPACLGGTIVGGTTFWLGLEASEQIKTITNNITTKTIQITKSASKVLPGYVREIIHECIGEPVEQSLKSAYTFGSETINKVTQTISQILYENWEKLKPEQTIVYCEDSGQNKISVELNKHVATRVYNYCQMGSKSFESGFVRSYGSGYLGTSKFEANFKDFESKINDFKHQMDSYDFVSRTTEPTPYELVAMDFEKSRPNPNLITRNKIKSNSIPDYQVSVHITGGGSGGSGIMAGIGGAVIIAVKVIFLF